MTCYKNVLIAVIAVARQYQRELSNLLPIGHLPTSQSHRAFTCLSKSMIEIVEQGVKSAQG